MAENEAEGKRLGWMHIITAVAGIVAVPSAWSLIWAGGMGTRVDNLERARQVDRQEVREDVKGIRDDVREIRRLIEEKSQR